MRELKYDVIRCPSGGAGVVECEGKIRKILLLGENDDPEKALLKLFAEGTALKKGRLDKTLYEWFKAYMRGVPPAELSFEFEPEGTAFQLKVWRSLLQIPFGKVLTYGELAAQVSCASAQAIGQAVGRNPLPIIIPCHRIVAAGMKLGGFTGGTHLKIKLLKHEGWNIDNSCIISK